MTIINVSWLGKEVLKIDVGIANVSWGSKALSGARLLLVCVECPDGAKVK